MTDTYTANIRVENFPRELDIKLNAIATRMQLPKKDIVRMALEEFVERHTNG